MCVFVPSLLWAWLSGNVVLMPTSSYSHGNVNNAIFKVSFVDNSWLVSGGQDGFARLYDWQSGQFLQRLEHSSGICSVDLDAILEPDNEFQ
jgi:WD40 repeat protein